MKFLKTIRFDPSDSHVFETAANPDEWAISGSSLFSNQIEADITGKRKQAFSNGFLSLEGLGFSTFVSVAEIDAVTVGDLKSRLANMFVSEFGAPSLDEALPVAEAEIQFVLDMCSEVAVNSIFAVSRSFDDEGEIHEEFRIVDAPSAKPHTRVWEIVED